MAMKGLITGVLDFERALQEGHERRSEGPIIAEHLLQRFLMPFAGRPAGRDRLSVFTTNYDRVIEFAADLLGMRIIDRFVGLLSRHSVRRASILICTTHHLASWRTAILKAL